MNYEQIRELRGNKISYIFQDPLSTLHPLIKIGKQLEEAFIEHNHQKNKEATLKGKELLKLVQIPNIENVWNSYPHELSGGMRQRVSIAMALTNDPELIIADEPTGNLDPETSSEIILLFKKLNSMGTSMIIATHDYNLILKLNGEVYKCEDGSIFEVKRK